MLRNLVIATGILISILEGAWAVEITSILSASTGSLLVDNGSWAATTFRTDSQQYKLSKVKLLLNATG